MVAREVQEYLEVDVREADGVQNELQLDVALRQAVPVQVVDYVVLVIYLKIV